MNPALVFSCFALLSVVLSSSAEKTTAVPSNHLIRIGPSANMLSEKEPAYLSIIGANTIRWVASSHLVIVFPDDGFPVLPDGTRVIEPPFVRMVHQDERWFVPCEAESCRSDTPNPRLLEILKAAKLKELKYTYRISLSSGQAYADVVLQP